MTKYLLGIDQGGTKTNAIICDNRGRILGMGQDRGLAKVYFDDTEELYIKRIVNASKQACEMAGISLSEVFAACAGLSGADWDFEYPILTQRLLRAVNTKDVVVLNDCIAAMRGGSAEKECAVVCAGSGLNVAVRRADGNEFIYGYYVDSIYQGASALGTAALRKVMEASLSVCQETMLTELILNELSYTSAEELMIDLSMGRYSVETKTLAPLLLRAFALGDGEAKDVVNSFAQGLAGYITAAMKRLKISGSNLDIVFSGSVFKDVGTLVAQEIFHIISLSEPNVRLVHARYEPVCGAALTLLDREWDSKLPEEVNVAFDKSATRYKLLRNLQVVPAD